MILKKVSELQVGDIVIFNNRKCEIDSLENQRTGKGGAYRQIILFDIENGKKYNCRPSTEESMDTISVRLLRVNFLYSDGQNAVCITKDTEEEINISLKSFPKNLLDFIDYLDKLELVVDETNSSTNLVCLSIRAIDSIKIQVKSTLPYLKGAAVKQGDKSIILENNKEIFGPASIQNGDWIFINPNNLTFDKKATN